MTREELVKLMHEEIHEPRGMFGIECAADRILAALEKERAGEVGLHRFPDTSGAYSTVEVPREIFAKRGSLIFREEGK